MLVTYQNYLSCCVKSQDNADLIYSAEDAWNHTSGIVSKGIKAKNA
jgi:hypothetical protein